MKIAIGADHGGFELKERLKALLAQRGIETDDVGTHSAARTDYPDYAREVVLRVLDGRVKEGILICRTGIGMSIAANRYPGIRAALCLTPDMAAMARDHNQANVLVLGGDLETAADAERILERWLSIATVTEERHGRRLAKVETHAGALAEYAAVRETDPETAAALLGEFERERDSLDLIASENHAGRAVRLAQGSIMTNKYAEGYPGKRWYNGCEYVDQAETLAIARARRLFGADHANVQPHSGSAANMAVYFAVLQPGDTILAMSLAHGGHLTHGHKVNFSGRLFHVVGYGVHRETERIDYDEVARLAMEHRPRLIVAGASAYPRTIEFEKLRAIADETKAMLMVDMAHIAGLVAAGCHPSPVPHAEFVTSTTHKTLRGPRSGLVLCREAYAAEVDRQVFPGLQGGPLMHTIAAKAVCFREALQPEFKAYQEQVVRNARVMAETLAAHGLRIVSGGTDNHLLLVDLTPVGITGRDAAAALEKAGITVNKNAIPFDQKPPAITSGIRIGTPAVTTRGMKEEEMRRIGGWIVAVMEHASDEGFLSRLRGEVRDFARAYPLP